MALSGFCPVCILDNKQWVRGNAQHQVTYDRKLYLFPSEEVRQTFLDDPGKYVPALGGDCTVDFARTGRRVPGSVYLAAYHKDRLYLFSGADQKSLFVQNPAQYAGVDLAINGICPVTRATTGEDVAGDPRFVAYDRGLRYQFAGEDQLKAFRENPRRFVPAQPGE